MVFKVLQRCVLICFSGSRDVPPAAACFVVPPRGALWPKSAADYVLERPTSLTRLHLGDLRVIPRSWDSQSVFHLLAAASAGDRIAGTTVTEYVAPVDGPV